MQTFLVSDRFSTGLYTHEGHAYAAVGRDAIHHVGNEVAQRLVDVTTRYNYCCPQLTHAYCIRPVRQISSAFDSGRDPQSRVKANWSYV